MKRIVFWNGGGKGDIHVSRSYVKYIASKFVDSDVLYIHHHGPELLLDIPGLQYSNDWSVVDHVRKNGKNNRNVVIDGTAYFHTWYGVSPEYNGCNIGTLHSLFKSHTSIISCPLPDVGDMIPKIDYSQLDTRLIDDQLTSRKKILICNNLPMSQQSHYSGSLDGLIDKLSVKCPKSTLFVTNEYGGLEKDNIVSVSDLTTGRKYSTDVREDNASPFNLNHISYLSTKCDVIIGRSSGPDTFCIVEENVMSDKDYFTICPKPLAESFFSGKQNNVERKWREHNLQIPYNENVYAEKIAACLNQ